MRPRRIVVKVGSSSVTEGKGQLSQDKLIRLVHQIVSVRNAHDCQIILVSSGAVAAGISCLGWRRATITIPEKQAAAAVGQGLLIDRYQKLFAQSQIVTAQLLLTRDDIEDRKRFVHIRNTLETLLHHDVLPIINENDSVAVDEIRFGDNDTLASFVALVADADLLILFTDIDGVYTANPRLEPSATLISDVYEITEELERVAGASGSVVGTGGMKTKLMAARTATQSGIDMVIAASAEENGLQRIVSGEKVGTRFHAHKKRLSAKRSWLIHGARTEGAVYIDAGAAAALSSHSRSLLLPGIIKVTGDFQEGAIVEMVAGDTIRIGNGVVNYSAWDLRLLLERRATGEKVVTQEVIHRNEMAIYQTGK